MGTRAKAVKPHRLQRKLVAVAVAACFAGRFAYANPVGPVVVSGQATFSASGRQLAITNTPGTIINWQQFSIQSNEATRFIQQSASSAVLNRVIGVDPSQILGDGGENKLILGASRATQSKPTEPQDEL